MKLRCLIVDDEPIARRGIQEFADEVEFLQVIGHCENAAKATAFLQENPVDLVFLDIQMPKTSGVEFLKSLSNPPMAIMTTAYPDYALEGFALDVVDYLVKPVAFDRFLKAVTKAHDLFQMKSHSSGEVPVNYFFVKSNGRYERILYSEIMYAEAWQNYCMLHLQERKLITYLTFSALEKQLSQDYFMKVHKSFIVSLPKIESMDGHSIRIGTAVIPVSRSLKEKVKQRILRNNLLKRL